jgi:hypothetical protein
MTQGPTTENGPLHDPAVTLDDRSMTATFRTRAEAEAARSTLLAAGFAEASIVLAGQGDGLQHAVEAPDQSLFGRLREAVLPDDSTTALRDAAARDETVLTLRPAAGQVEAAVQILQAANPHHFDAALERWRNAG